jgi:hypothetical protein
MALSGEVLIPLGGGITIVTVSKEFNPKAYRDADVTGVLLPVWIPCLRRSQGG